MGKGVSSCSDLAPVAEKLLEDRQWHCMSEVVRVVGPHIPPERATWFFQAMRPEKTPGKCDTMQKVREGTRRGVYLLLRQLMGRGMVECRETIDPSLPKKPDNREYRMIMSSEELSKAKSDKKKPEAGRPQPKPKKQRPKRKQPMSTTIEQPEPTSFPKDSLSSAMAFLEDVDAIRDLFAEQFPKSEDRDDLEFHLRHVKRIITLNFLSKPKIMSPPAVDATEISTAIVKG